MVDKHLTSVREHITHQSTFTHMFTRTYSCCLSLHARSYYGNWNQVSIKSNRCSMCTWPRPWTFDVFFLMYCILDILCIRFHDGRGLMAYDDMHTHYYEMVLWSPNGMRAPTHTRDRSNSGSTIDWRRKQPHRAQLVRACGLAGQAHTGKPIRFC